jgi:FAD/FMN-containing dehydrogenase
MGGAMARVPAEATAFAHRAAPIMLLVITPYEDPATAPAHVAWTVALHDKLAANDVGVYSNFLEVEGEARIRAAYPPATYERLAQVKRHYDPANLFRLNQNIRPSVAVR